MFASGILLAAAAATPPPQDGSSGQAGGPTIPIEQGPSPLEFVIPGLIVGVPVAVVILVVILQLAGGAAWLPLVRRWLGRRL